MTNTYLYDLDFIGCLVGFVNIDWLHPCHYRIYMFQDNNLNNA